MKIVTWNVNGIRAALKKGFREWLISEAPDVVCLQETKAHPSQLECDWIHELGYQAHWSSAERKGYSGVAIWVKRETLEVREGINLTHFDQEGRTLIAEFSDCLLFNSYYPNGRHDLSRVDFKLEYSDAVLELALKLHQEKKKPVILAGDFNTAHQEIDLARPKENVGNTGFLPRERAWIDKLVGAGFVDVFREFEKGPGHYTWWSYRSGAKQRNVGWRIDYFFTTPDFVPRIKTVYHQPDLIASDHCPVVMVCEVDQAAK